MTIRINTTVLKHELLSPSVLLGGLGVGILYVLTSTLLINIRLIIDTVSGAYPLSHKFNLVLTLFQGIFTLYSPTELLLLLTLGFLMGINILLVTRSLRERKKQQGDWTLGLGFLGIVAATGCASCGITLLSLLGPTVSLTLLPFQGFLLQGVSFVLLVISLIHTLNRRSNNCIIAKP